MLSALVDGLAGTTPIALRGLLNATVNLILTRMAAGLSYETTGRGTARRACRARSSADVEGHDAVAKVMILSASCSAGNFAASRSHAAASLTSSERRPTGRRPAERD